TIERRLPRAKDAAQRIQHSRLESGGRHKDLEYGTRSKMTLNRPVQHGMTPIFHQAAVIIRRNACCKKVGVIGRPADERQNLARTRIQSNERTHLTACELAILSKSGEAIFRRVLQIEIDCRDQIVSTDRRFFLELPHLAAEAVHDDALESVFADERIVVFALEPGLSNLIAGFVIYELIR